ncbi:MAG: excinuclease ABC subunit UvrC, partial [Thermoflexaceae bacterium]|nr:excinuclease ABC subunit UvrC [Thermoflexaceae bacterium]
NIEEELKKLPGKPGVYIMHDKTDEIIYVGKAISLKNRVRQYFQSSRNKSPKIIKMVEHIDHFEYIITDSELEALVLECNLIKEHRPKYNTMLKDDKSYPYIKVTVGEEFPRILFARQMKRDKAKYFGPYTSAGAVKDTIELLRKIYRIRTCNKVLPKDIGMGRPCLNYHIKQCDAPCQGCVSKEEYNESVKKALEFLNGNYHGVIAMLTQKMQDAAGRMEFEEAAEYRDLLNSVKQIAQKQKITNSDMENKDIIACAIEGDDAVIQVFFVRDGKLMGREHFHMNMAIAEDRKQIVTGFIKEYYGGTPFIPAKIVVQDELEEAEVIASWLSKRRGQKVHVEVPKRGQKEKLVELAEKNARMVLDQDLERIRRESERTFGAMAEIGKLLNLPELKRVEAFDISNISGMESVGSMVVFENGKPKRNDYRRFKIRYVKGPDDYASMEEVLTRRFTHGQNERETGEFTSFSVYPDLIMMDGGRGQVNVALRVLDSLQIHIPVCGMVKDDNHRTRGLYYNNVELPIDTHGEGFKLITRVQDEAHRFAIEYHRSLRGQAQIKSVLDEIEGVGPARRKALMKYFKDIDAIKKAEVEELKKADGITQTVAQNIYNYFH